MKELNFPKDFWKIARNASHQLIKKSIKIFDKWGGGDIIRYIYFIYSFIVMVELLKNAPVEPVEDNKKSTSSIKQETNYKPFKPNKEELKEILPDIDKAFKKLEESVKTQLIDANAESHVESQEHLYQRDATIIGVVGKQYVSQTKDTSWNLETENILLEETTQGDSLPPPAPTSRAGESAPSYGASHQGVISSGSGVAE